MFSNKQQKVPGTVSKRHPGRRAVLVTLLLMCIAASPTVCAETKMLADQEITDAIELQLLLDDAVDANNIDVSTSAGIVTLSGSVNSLLAADQAKAIARNITGVLGIDDELLISHGKHRTDAELEAAVDEALLVDPATESYEVEATVNNGFVTLTGTVDSWQEKELAGIVTKGVRGVMGVKNDIDVVYKDERADSEIKSEIEQCLKYDVRVDDLLINVGVHDGEVTLSGTVGSLNEKHQARRDAWVAGVKDVNDDGLDIEYWARDTMRRTDLYTSLTDEEIKEAVTEALLRDPRVLALNTTARVSDGTVSLSGVVDSLKAKRAAENDARNIVGVWRVKNNLKVRQPVIPANDEIEKRVHNALLQDPYVESYDVAVDASYGWVTLSGTVNTSFEKQQAELVTEGVPGVLRVFNNIHYEHQWRWKPDMEIKADVEEQLALSPFVDANDIRVAVEDGVVILTGNVDTWSERINAINSAYDGGAKRVKCAIKVKYNIYGPSPEVGPHFWWNPYRYGYTY